MRSALLCVSSLLLLTTCSAQVATIDMRGLKPTRPSLHIGRGSSDGGGSHDALELIVTLSDPSHLSIGKAVDYELLVTNRTGKPVSLPKAAAWSEVDDVNLLEKRYLDSHISFEIFAADGNLGFFDESVPLYGYDARPETLAILQPGESVRILGSTPFTPRWQHPPAPGTAMRLMAFLVVSQVILHPPKAHEDSYSSEGHQIYNVESDGNLNIEIQAPW